MLTTGHVTDPVLETIGDNETELQEFWERASSWVQEMESDWGEMTGTGASSFCRAAQ